MLHVNARVLVHVLFRGAFSKAPHRSTLDNCTREFRIVDYFRFFPSYSALVSARIPQLRRFAPVLLFRSQERAFPTDLTSINPCWKAKTQTNAHKEGEGERTNHGKEGEARTGNKSLYGMAELSRVERACYAAHCVCE